MKLYVYFWDHNYEEPPSEIENKKFESFTERRKKHLHFQFQQFQKRIFREGWCSMMNILGQDRHYIKGIIVTMKGIWLLNSSEDMGRMMIFMTGLIKSIQARIDGLVVIVFW